MGGAARDAFNSTTADQVEAIGMRVLPIAEEMASGRAIRAAAST